MMITHVQPVVVGKNVAQGLRHKGNAEARDNTEGAARGVLRQEFHKDVERSIHISKISN